MSTNTLKRPSESDNSTPRKVRKGTQSCWECKRRKVRCTFAASDNSICEPCTQRGTVCVSQELPDPGRTSQIDDRINRVETVLEEVLRRLPVQRDDQQPLRQDQHAESGVREPPPNPSPIHGSVDDAVSRQASTQDHRQIDPNLSSTTGPDELFRKLIATAAEYPTRHELGLISREPFEIPSCLHGLPCVQSLKNRPSLSWQELMSHPAPGSHPIVPARLHLILASYLQTLSSGAMERLSLLGVDHQGIASNAVQNVRRLVLSDNELIRSLDGIECLYIESMYHNNAGRLRDAWLILRNAISIAQVLGMDRRAFPQLSHTRPHGKEGKEESIWYHLLASDRYLSLMLGLPQGAPNSNSFSFPEAMAPHAPDERLRRTHCAAGGIMLKHTTHHGFDTAYIEEVDMLLRDAAANLNPQWWLIPESLNRGQLVTAEDTLRLMTQFTHYHILARLHLPYLLKSPADGTFDPHKLTTVNASREILVRYLALRGSPTTNNYCRGVDYLMFIAATTLCIAHINSSHWRRLNGQGPHFDFLAHQRPGDVGLMQRALEITKGSWAKNGDKADRNIGMILESLLQTENEAAMGSIYNISTTFVHPLADFPGERSNDSNNLRIEIPFVGTIKIEKERASASRSSGSAFAVDNWPEGHDSHDAVLYAQRWTLDGIDAALFNDLIQDWQVGDLDP